jgi:ABC-type dipeptide/oligopeptide/nickel transport system permease component
LRDCSRQHWFASGPGFDGRRAPLDSRLNAQSVRSLYESRSSERDLPNFYVRYLAGLMRGDLGVSHSLAHPVVQLILERAPMALSLMAAGILGGW